MSTPLEKFVRAAKISKLIEVDELSARFVSFRETVKGKAEPGSDAEAKQFAELLVKAKLLTSWQSGQLLRGKKRGFRIGNYKLISLLGKGGMGSVFLAEHEVMSRRVAIKILPQPKFRKASYLGRFQLEAKAVAALDHPNIVRAFDYDTEKIGDVEMNYFIMEYIDGASLGSLIRKRGPMSPIEAVHYLRQAAEGLAHAHDAGLIHRDVKPDNLLVDRQGTVKILDLGLARFVDDDHSLTIEHNDKVVGTTDFLAPEQAVDSHTVDSRADIYALGCTLFFLLTGAPPFNEGAMAERLIAHQTKEPPALKNYRKDVPATLEQLMLKLMAKKADDRPQTAAEVSLLFGNWLSQHLGTNMSMITPPSSVFSGTLSGTQPGSTVQMSQAHGPLSGIGSTTTTSNVFSRERATELILTKPRLSAAIAGTLVCLFLVIGTIAGSLLTSDKTVVASTGDPKPIDTTPEVAAVVAEDTKPSVSNRQQPKSASDTTNSSPTHSTETNPTETMIAKANDKPSVVEPKPAPEPKVTWDPITPAAPQSLIHVGPNGDFTSVRDAILHLRDTMEPVSEDNDADADARPTTVRLAAGETFHENLIIGTGGSNSFPEFVTIESDANNPAKIVGNGKKPVVIAKFVNEVTIRNIVFDCGGAPVGFELAGYLRNVLFENIEIGGFAEAAITGGSLSGVFDRKLIFDGLVIRGSSHDQVGITITTEKRDAAAIQIFNSRFIGPLKTGLTIDGSSKGFLVQHTIFDNITNGVVFTGETIDFTRFQSVGNTFHNVETPLLFAHAPTEQSTKLTINKNLFNNTGPELRIADGFDREKFANAFSDGGWVGENFSTRRAFDNVATDEYRIVQPGGFKIANAKFLSTNPNDPDYLRPNQERLNSSPFGNEPHYVGAVPGK